LNGLDNETADEDSDRLSGEHDSRRHFHVMTEFHVTRERGHLPTNHNANGFEYHIRHRFSFKQVPCDELQDNIWADLLIRDGLDHRDRYGQNT
jgi:hypothetical protein